MTLLHGIAPHRAKLTIARDMLATMWAMWKKGEKYNPEIREKAASQTGLGLATVLKSMNLNSDSDRMPERGEYR